jgi:hypothetical protein
MNTANFPPPWGIAPEVMADPSAWTAVQAQAGAEPLLVFVYDRIRQTGAIYCRPREQWSLVTPISAVDFAEHCFRLMTEAGLLPRYGVAN